MDTINLSNVTTFGELEIGDLFIFNYELRWIKHAKGGIDYSWKKGADKKEEFVGEIRLPYKIWSENLPLLGIYRKGDDGKYTLVEIAEDFRKKITGKPLKWRGVAYYNVDVRRVI